MQAIVQDGYGTRPEAVLRLAEIARPTSGDDDILVRIAAASVDKGTWHLMTGLPYAMRRSNGSGPDPLVGERRRPSGAAPVAPASGSRCRVTGSALSSIYCEDMT